MYLINKVYSDKVEKIYTQEYFFPIIYFEQELKDIERMLVSSVYSDPKLGFGGFPDYFKDEIKLLAEIRNKARDFPKDEYELSEAYYDEKLNPNNKYLLSLMDRTSELYDHLSKACHLSINKVFNPPNGYKLTIGKELRAKSLLTMKKDGGAGLTEFIVQTCCLRGKKERVLLINTDTGKRVTGRTPSSYVGDSEALLSETTKKKREQGMLSRLFNLAPEEKLDDGNYTFDLLKRHSDDRNKDFRLLLYKGVREDLKVDLFKFMRLAHVTEYESLKTLMRIYIDFAQQISNYDLILFDSGPLNTPSFGFLGYYLNNLMIAVPFDDYEIAQYLEPQRKIRSTIDLYNEMRQEIEKLYKNDPIQYKTRHNLLLVINERSKTTNWDTPNYITSEYYQKTLDNHDKIIGSFNENLTIKPADIASILLPYYWQLHLNDKAIPIIADLPANSKLLNKIYYEEFIKAQEAINAYRSRVYYAK